MPVQFRQTERNNRMKHLVIFALLVILCPAHSFGQAGGKKTDSSFSLEQRLAQLKRDWGKAYVRRDAAFLENLLGEEYTVTDADGQTTNRKQIMADFHSGETTYEATSYEDAKVRIYGNVAIVAGRGTVKGRSKSGAFHRQYFSTNILVKRNGRWQAVATHISGVTSL